MKSIDYPPNLVEEVEQFLTQDRCEPGRDIYDDIFRNQVFFPLQRKRELQQMIEMARSVCPRTIMEIGACSGASLYHWCKCFPDVRRVIACEVRGCPYAHLFERAFPDISFLWLEESSYDPRTVAQVNEWLGVFRIDVLFIDGEKVRFLEDFQAYLPYMSSRGVVFMHDQQDNPPCEQAFAKASLGYRSQRVVDLADWSALLYRSTVPAKGIVTRESLGQLTPYEEWLWYWRGRSCGFGAIWMDRERR